jgi:argininosuccinate lyase
VKLWGSRFHGEASPTAELFGASIGFDRRLWPHDLIGSAAHCRMLARQAIISREDARHILDGLRMIEAELEFGQVDFDARWEDIHTRVEGRLVELIGEPARRLHTARSRNDQVATDLRLFAREAILVQVHALATLQAELIDLAQGHAGALMPGYTHLRRAQPVLFAHYLLAYVEMFDRDAARLLDCYRRTDVLPLGSGALAGVPYPLDRDFTAKLLGFGAVSRNSMDAVSDRDFVVEHVSALALEAAHLSRLAEDLILWASDEFGFLQIGDAHSTGSSIMPQKRNPDVAELIRGKTGRVYGHLMGLLTILKGLPLTYNKDLQEDKEAYFDALDTTLACTGIMAEMLRSLVVRTAEMDRAAGARFSTATDYADYLTRKGLPFRDAHEIVGRLVRDCESRGIDLDDLPIEALRAASPLFEPDAVAFSAPQSVASRNVAGGTAPSRVAEAIRSARGRTDELIESASRMRDALPTLRSLLDPPLDDASPDD